MENTDFNGTNYLFLPPREGFPTVLCVHGIGSYHSDFLKLSQRLSNEGYGVVMYDLIGRGYSAYPIDDRFNSDAHIDQLRNLVVHLNIRSGPKYHIVAHSMGGALVAIYANSYGSEIESITFLSPAGLMDSGPIPLLRCCSPCFHGIVKSVLRGGQEKVWRENFVVHDGESLKYENESIDMLTEVYKTNPLMFEAFFQSVLQFPLYGLDTTVQNMIKKYDISILLMWGKLDKAVPFDPNFLRWKNIIDSSSSIRDEGDGHSHEEDLGRGDMAGGRVVRYSVFDNMAHGLHLEYPDIVNEDIANFINSIYKSK